MDGKSGSGFGVQGSELWCRLSTAGGRAASPEPRTLNPEPSRAAPSSHSAYALSARLLALALTAVVVATCAEGLSAEAAEPGRPNVVMILSDDQTYRDFGFMGNPLVRTPHIDRLAEQSARYVQGYVPSSVCRPSLATLLTGLYPHQHGIHFNHPPPGNKGLNGMSQDDYYAARAEAEKLFRCTPSLPRILVDCGYDCLQTGKFWEGHYQNAGFTHGMTTGLAAGAAGCWDKQLTDGTTVAHGNGDAGLTIGRSTMKPLTEFIQAHAAPEAAPFLIWYAPVLPHEPHDPPDEYLEMYRSDPRVPPNFAPYYANCTWFDDTVGRLIESLEEHGLVQNTLFVFVVDNGWTPSESTHPKHPGFDVDKRSKRSPFEDGLRTPILVRWDGHVLPATHRELVGSIDIVPTILHALGLGDRADEMPGIDLMPSASGREPLPNRPVFGEIYPGDATSLGNPSRDVAYRWVRDGDLKLIVPHRHGPTEPWGDYLSDVALFDVVKDKAENSNLAGDPAYAAQRKRLRSLLDDWWTPSDN